MLFAINASVMDGPEKVLDALDAIVVRAEHDVHEIEIIDADILQQSAWYASSRTDRKKLLEQVAEASLHRTPRTKGPHLRRIVVDDATSAHNAKNDAYAPLLVLLENDQSDGQLIESAIRVFGQPVTIDLCFGSASCLEPPAFRMESRGGAGELVKLVERCLKEANERGRSPRIVVIADSDGEWPGDIKQHAQTIRSYCADKQIPCPPMNMRTAENYIPDAVWRAWAASRSADDQMAAEAIIRLSPTQRDHVHLAKRGKAPWDCGQPMAAALFSGVSDADRDVLEQASLKGRGANMVIFALRDHHQALTPSSLRARDHHGDLAQIVQQIEDEL